MDDMILRRSLGVLAIVSALSLGGYFVWYRHHQTAERAKQENHERGESQPPLVFPSSKNLDVVFRSDPEKNPEFLPGSKMGPFLKPKDVPVGPLLPPQDFRLTRETPHGTHEARKSPEAAPDPEAPPK